jgi:translation initiation factor IF-3
MNKNNFNVNGRIRASEIRLIDDAGEQVGIFPTVTAINMARSKGLDLVEVSSAAIPPVCRMQDFNKFLYDQSKSLKKQKVVKIKEIKLSPQIGDHDYITRLRHATEFLREGSRVKISLRFRGRQMAHKELGFKVVNRLLDDVAGFGKIESSPKLDGNTIQSFIVPK